MAVLFAAKARYLQGLSLLWMALLVGCSSTPPIEDPDPLPEIVESVELEEVWSASIGDGMDGQHLFLTPAIVEGKLYAVDVEGELYALDALTGEELWYKALDRPILAGVGADRQHLYLVGLNGELLALNRENGEVQWTAPLPAEVLAAPQSNNDQLVVATIDGRLIGFDVGTGERLWRYDSDPAVLSYRGTAEPYVDNERVLAGFSNGMLMSFDVLTGAPLWEYQVSVPTGRTEIERLVDIDGEPIVIDNAVLVVGYQGQIAALDIGTGQELWTRQASSLKRPGVGNGNLYVSEADGTLVAYNGFSRSEAWRIDTLSWRRLTAPVSYGNLITVGDFEGYLHLISQEEGTFVGRVQVDDEGLRVTPQTFEDLLIVFGNSGELVAYRLPEDDEPSE